MNQQVFRRVFSISVVLAIFVLTALTPVQAEAKFPDTSNPVAP